MVGTHEDLTVRKESAASLKGNARTLTNFHFKTTFIAALWLQNEEVEVDMLQYLVHLACSSVHHFELAPAALAHLWVPNGSLPQAVSLSLSAVSKPAESCVDGMLHCLFSVQTHCLLSRVFVYSVCLCLLLA